MMEYVHRQAFCKDVNGTLNDCINQFVEEGWQVFNANVEFGVSGCTEHSPYRVSIIFHRKKPEEDIEF